MSRCLQLATAGAGKVAPNPMVGCVITVADAAMPLGQRIIGEGYHQQYGGAHAEVNAMASVTNPGLLEQARLYVNLEPCSHYGQTPPCANLIIDKKIPEVVIGSQDPHVLVRGRGIRLLKHAGIKVHANVLEDECIFLNRRFFTYHQKKRPYIILKWAQTQDGFLARKDYSSKWISNRYSRAFVHKLRSGESGIMVGTNTALYDNPSLTVRKWTGKNPHRILIDRKLKVPISARLFENKEEVIVFNGQKEEVEGNITFKKIEFGKNSLNEILKQLFEMKILSVLVEGGSLLLKSFIARDLWDEAYVFTGPEIFVAGIEAPLINLKPSTSRKIVNNNLNQYFNNHLKQ